MLNVAIAGYGNWGRKLVAAVQGRSELLRFSAIVTRDPAALADEARALGALAVGSLDAALARADVEAVVLATPHSLHAGQVAACARAGKPVFVEKPFALTARTAAEALAACPPGMVVAAGHNRRFLPAVQALKAAVEAGDMGRLLCIEGNFSGNVAGRYKAGQWRASQTESPAGGLAGAGIHTIDLMIHLAGPISGVAAQSARRALEIEIDDTTSALFAFAGGAQGTLVSVMASAPDFRLKLFGTRASAELRGERLLRLHPVGGEAEEREFPEVSTERAELEAFARAVRGGPAYPVSRDDILNGVAAFEAVSRAAAARAWVDL
jgi:predicted dehydrogenase